MCFRVYRRLLSSPSRHKELTFKEQSRGLKVCVLGAMGGIGQPLSLMVKQSQWFEEAALYDTACCRGLAMELNQIDTPCLVTAYEGEDGMRQALKSSHLVINAAGIPRSPNMTDRNQLFNANAGIVYKLTKEIAQQCPQAFYLLVTNPVNTLVPLAIEVFKHVNGCVDPARVFGVTSVDTLRASSFVADITQTPPETIKVPVIGGHSGTTMVPLLSQTKPCVSLTTEEIVRITRAVQFAGDEVSKAKEGTGTATLSVAYSCLRLAENLARALFGQQGLVECSYIFSNLIPDVKYFASPFVLGPMGIEKILPLPELSNYEGCLLHMATEGLKKDIEKGEKYLTS